MQARGLHLFPPTITTTTNNNNNPNPPKLCAACIGWKLEGSMILLCLLFTCFCADKKNTSTVKLHHLVSMTFHFET